MRKPDYSDKEILALGGTPASQAAVAAGLDWLARHQAEDGHWGPDCMGGPQSRCEKGPACTVPGGDCRYAQTGLAILAFQAAGHFEFNERKYSKAVRQGLNWLVKHQTKDVLFVRNPSIAITCMNTESQPLPWPTPAPLCTR